VFFVGVVCGVWLVRVGGGGGWGEQHYQIQDLLNIMNQ